MAFLAHLLMSSTGCKANLIVNATITQRLACAIVWDIAVTNVLKLVRCMGQILCTVLPNGMDKLNLSSNEPLKGNMRIQILSTLFLIPCIHIFYFRYIFLEVRLWYFHTVDNIPTNII